MHDNFDACIALVLQHEGGYVNNPKDPKDPGGATNLGVTKKVWEEWVGKPVSVDDMKALTVDDVKPLYKAQYWNRIKADDLPVGVDYACFDTAVNSGVVRAIKFLQSALGLNADGIVGPNTINAAAEANPRTLVSDICEKRLAFMQSLPIWNTFGKGWQRRVEEVEKKAFEMAS